MKFNDIKPEKKKKRILGKNYIPSDVIIRMPKNSRDTNFLKDLCK